MPPFCLPGSRYSCPPHCMSATVSVWVSACDLFLSVCLSGSLAVYLRLACTLYVLGLWLLTYLLTRLELFVCLAAYLPYASAISLGI